MSRFIYEVRPPFDAPKSAGGYFSTPAGAALAVTKQGGQFPAAMGVFNHGGLVSLIKGLKVDKSVHIVNARITKHSLK